MNPENSKSCKCGHKMDDPWIVPNSKYTFFGWLMVSIGISHPPVKVIFQCEKCGESVKTITDKNELKSHAFH
jgi:hypothetical protein